ncbi:unnamed protein product, partial [Urochloa humidicola]
SVLKIRAEMLVSLDRKPAHTSDAKREDAIYL